jgi:hypothetical protein
MDYTETVLVDYSSGDSINPYLDIEIWGIGIWDIGIWDIENSLTHCK